MQIANKGGWTRGQGSKRKGNTHNTTYLGRRGCKKGEVIGVGLIENREWLVCKWKISFLYSYIQPLNFHAPNIVKNKTVYIYQGRTVILKYINLYFYLYLIDTNALIIV